MVRLIFLLFFIFYSFLPNSSCQKQDHIWLFGEEFYDVIDPILAADTTRGATNFDFNHDPVRIYYDPDRQWDVSGGNASLSDAEGNLLAYANGQVLIHGSHQPIEDTINYGYDVAPECGEWEYTNYGTPTKAIPTGVLGHSRIYILPLGDRYYVVYDRFNRCMQKHDLISYARFEITDSHPYGRLIDKDKIVIRDTFAGGLCVTRHGNGRDWWLVNFSSGHEFMYVYLINQDGVRLHNKLKTGLSPRPSSTGQITVSPNGRFLAFYDAYDFTATGGRFGVVDFDRCDGSFSNLRFKVLPAFVLGFGTSFSSDSRYLYVCNGVQIRQYDMQATNFLLSERLAAQYDGYEYFFPEYPNSFGSRVNFNLMKLGPDGKIYVFPSSADNRKASVIEQPTDGYTTCDVRQHSISLPTIYSRTVPTIADFRLGPVDGGACDTLGIDNHPIAKYRYTPDSTNHLRVRFTDLSYFRPEKWVWDFGDGSPQVSQRHHFHTYAQNGTYRVCLTVSNENSSNTLCRTITLGTSSSDDVSTSRADVSLYPNPVQDDLLVTLGEYVPSRGYILIYDITGRPVITQRIYYGQNSVDMSALQSGMYVWKLMDGEYEIREGKVVKM